MPLYHQISPVEKAANLIKDQLFFNFFMKRVKDHPLKSVLLGLTATLGVALGLYTFISGSNPLVANSWTKTNNRKRIKNKFKENDKHEYKRRFLFGAQSNNDIGMLRSDWNNTATIVQSNFVVIKLLC